MLSDSEETLERIMNEIETLRKQLTVPGVSGLVNLGNTCYMNAALQNLLATDLLAVYLVGTKTSDASYKNDLKNGCAIEIMKQKKCEAAAIDPSILRKKFKETLTYALRKIFVIMYNTNCKVKPVGFKYTLGKSNPMFAGLNQHDSQEALSSVLEKIHEETKSDVNVTIDNSSPIYSSYIAIYQQYIDQMKSTSLSKSDKHATHITYMNQRKNNLQMDTIVKYLFYWKTFLKNNHSVIIDIFTGLYIQLIECNKCKHINTSFESYNVITLPIEARPTMTLIECLENYLLSSDPLVGVNQYSCEYCDDKCDASKVSLLWSAPPRLIIQMKRFNNRNGKINTVIDFPMTGLNMNKFMPSYVTEEYTYDLYGVICHSGNAHFGHYIAFTKNAANGLWYLYDDSAVLQVVDVERRIKNSEAYVLFYKKRGDAKIVSLG